MDVVQMSKMLGIVDLKITVGGGGPSGQAGAVRYLICSTLPGIILTFFLQICNSYGTQELRRQAGRGRYEISGTPDPGHQSERKKEAGQSQCQKELHLEAKIILILII